MSNHLISMAYKRNLGSVTRKALLVLMADKASDDGSGIWASKPTMADELCTSKPTILRTLKSLIDDGIIKETGRRDNSHGYTVEYAIVVHSLEALPLVKCHRRRQSRGGTGNKVLPGKDRDPCSNTELPDQLQSVTQTLQDPTINRKSALREKTDSRKPKTKDSRIPLEALLDNASEEFLAAYGSLRGAPKTRLIESAYLATRRLLITQDLWGEACSKLGRESAAACVLLIDRNSNRTDRFRIRVSPSACLRGLITHQNEIGTKLSRMLQAIEASPEKRPPTNFGTDATEATRNQSQGKLLSIQIDRILRRAVSQAEGLSNA